MAAFSFKSGIIAVLLTHCLTAIASPSCRDLNIPVMISASGYEMPKGLSAAEILNNISNNLQNLANMNINGTYNIFARYCEPEKVIAKNASILQLLVHGSTSSHEYWSGYDFSGTSYQGANYSWVSHASQQGYPTLAIDRLGNGNSEHPDPSIVQLPAHVEVNHALVTAVKSGALNLGRPIKEVIYIGHSLGSVIGHLYLAKHPTDISRAMLQGFGKVTLAELGSLLYQATNTATQPAALADPARFGSLPTGYVSPTAATKNGTLALSFYGYGDAALAGTMYDPALPELSWAGRGTTTSGEGVTTLLTAITVAADFNGRVLVSTGQRDAYFCGYGALADCGTGAASVPAQTRELFPAAKSFDYFVPAGTGHQNIYHCSKEAMYANAFAWFAKYS